MALAEILRYAINDCGERQRSKRKGMAGEKYILLGKSRRKNRADI